MRLVFTIFFCSLAMVSCSRAWKPAGDRITTSWGGNLDPSSVLQEYPRPQMVRDEWKCLNGLWEYDIIPNDSTEARGGHILVPFALESALSGVGDTLHPGEKIHYVKKVRIPRSWKGRHVLLHFGAVDQVAEVAVNGKALAVHEGGYAPFSVDISGALRRGRNTIEVTVSDEVRDSFYGVGKQLRDPNTIWYTPVSGIWQTVWMEPVPENYIGSLRILPSLEESTLYVTVEGMAGEAAVELLEDGKVVASSTGEAGSPIALRIDNPRLWTPDTPFLYDLNVSCGEDGVKSYAAMRSFGVGKPDKDGFKRFLLNGKPIFMMGPLDQGWWPDGLYTAPSDSALIFDVEQMKALGFNAVRKHVKVEPDRWYWHCDRLGLIVWQDMPCGGMDISRGYWPGRYSYIDKDIRPRSEESMAVFYHEWGEIMDALYNHPSIAVWVPFNEGWGQSHTPEVAAWTAAKDPSRLVNAASGGNFIRKMGGDIFDMHKYPAPAIKLIDRDFINVLGEYGGIGMTVPGHTWVPSEETTEDDGFSAGNTNNWSYDTSKGMRELSDKYVQFADILLNLVPEGYSAGIYTQLSDVEIEINGLFTYDRKCLKIDTEAARKANYKLIHSLDD